MYVTPLAWVSKEALGSVLVAYYLSTVGVKPIQWNTVSHMYDWKPPQVISEKEFRFCNNQQQTAKKSTKGSFNTNNSKENQYIQNGQQSKHQHFPQLHTHLSYLTKVTVNRAKININGTINHLNTCWGGTNCATHPKSRVCLRSTWWKQQANLAC